ncbi:MAG: tetratricopeptide repeat protein [Thermoanaerobaculaceae bacterium]|jgi:predicted ATPase/DNA-binding SARP family transcriptional activator|nr:tetratricopeptide repeat protein [Thermoanaerobaculaceae bacterium]
MAEPVPPAWRIRLLGGCEISGPAGPVCLESAKTTALLAYLALHDGPQPRARLCGLLWPELPEERAAANLRRALWDQRRKLILADGRPLVVATRTTAAFDHAAPVSVDAAELSRCLGPSVAAADEHEEVGTLGGAVELYRGELLDGLFLDDAPELEEWIVAARERFRLLAVEALDRLTALYRRRGDHRLALLYARRLLNLDPWREQSHRTVMELLDGAGEPAAALAQFEACRRILAEQLQSAPTRETSALAERIRAAAPTVTSGTTPPAPMPARHRLPRPSTPFVGRRTEVDEVLARLATPPCRLLTLVGPGGIGKTRLALQVAGVLADGGTAARAAFPDGVVFVQASEVGGTGALAAALGVALGLHAPDEPSIESAIVDFLREKRAVVVVDGAEHRLAEARLLSTLLAQAPELAILATSRVRLRLREEWILEVPGLSCPPEGELATAGRSDATRLFLETARRAAPTWRPSPRELEAVAEICRAVEGNPLAIELAASWLRVLPVEEIARRVAHDISALEAPSADQRGLRAVLGSSFEQLGSAEQQAAERLSVFVGGFSRDAAAEVGEVSLEVLGALVDSSFVRLGDDGRYSMHELLRQHARERLGRVPRAAARMEDRRAAHLARLLSGAQRALWGPGQPEVLRLVAAEMGNLAAAWRWAVRRGNAAVLADCLPCLWGSWLLRGASAEGIGLLSEAIEDLARPPASHDRLVAALCVARGSLRNRIGQYGAAEADLRRASALAAGPGQEDLGARAAFHLGEAAHLQGRYDEARLGLVPCLDHAAAKGDLKLTADTRSLLGRVALEQGRHGDARRELEAGLDAARRLGDPTALTHAFTHLGLIEYFDGAFEAARRSLEPAARLAREAGHTATLAQAVAGLSYLLEDQGDFDGARRGYEEVLAIAERSGDRRGIAYATMLIGETARRQGRFAEAVGLYERALGIATVIGSRFLEGLLLGNLAYAAAAAGEGSRAREHIRAALRAYRRSGAHAVALPALVSRAELAFAEGDRVRALELLGLVLAHPANRQDHTVETNRVLARIRTCTGPVEVESGLAAGAALDLEATVEALLGEALPRGQGAPG